MNQGKTWYLSLPTYHVAETSILFRCFVKKAILKIDKAQMKDKVIRRNYFNCVCANTKLTQNKSTSPEKLSIFIGGGKINKNFIQQLISKGYPVYTSYGMTETASTFSINKITSAENYNNSGKPLSGNEIKIIQGKLAIKTPKPSYRSIK